MLRTLKTLLLLVLFVGAAIPAGALESAPVSSPRATVSMVSDTDAVAPGTPFRAGLHFQLAPGWHTYWQNPGDAGISAELELTLPPGSKAGPIVWPTPQRTAEGQLMTYAYTGDLLLPFTVTPGQDADGMTVQAHAQWLVCKDICVPEEGDFRLDLPVGHRRPIGAGAIVRGARQAGAASLAMAGSGGRRRNTGGAGSGAVGGNGGRCLVYP